ncbi:MAG: hypothetical protein ACOX6P_01195 [Candidatus Merdivicinus sp.]
MSDLHYSEAYLHLFNRVTDALRLLSQKNPPIHAVRELLTEAQSEAEELAIAEETPDVVKKE